MFNEAYYLRFLTSNHFDVHKASEQLKHNIAWRNEHKIDLIMDSDVEHQDDIRRFFPHGFLSQDNKGRPFYILSIGQLKS